MKLSVVLATYNGERYIKAQLESLAGQTRPADEVLIFDDASDDQTCAMVRRFIEGKPGWKIEGRLRNTGYRRNFHDLLSRATGEIIFLCDQDDVWDAEKLARFEAFFECHPNAQAVLSDYALVDAALRPIPGAQGAQFLQRYAMQADGRLSILRRDPLLWAHGSVAPGCCMAVTRAARDKYIKISTCQMPHDWELAIIADAMDGLYALDEKLTQYRQHGANEIGMKTGTKPLKMRGSMEKRLEVHGNFEGVTHAMESCATTVVGEKLLLRMQGYCAARRAFLEKPGCGTLLSVYRYHDVYARAIDARGRLGDLKIALRY